MKKSGYLLLLAGLVLAGCNDTLTSHSSPESRDDAQAQTYGKKGGAVPPAACDVEVPDDHSTIQGAVDAASAGDDVCVDGGTYTEQVVINKDLTLKGMNEPTIEIPSSPAQFTIPESGGNTWEPVVFAFGGASSGGKVTGTGTVDVSVSGFTVDGQQREQAGVRVVGLFFRNVQSTGRIAENTVQMAIGGGQTFGVLAYGNTKVTIAGNTINGYERGGIGANGDGGTHPAPDVVITGNEVTGSTGIGEGWGPNGIQIGFGATGQITNNVVRDNRFGGTPAEATSAGIIVFGSGGVMVRGNQVINSDIALATASAENNRLVKNEVYDAIYGAFFSQAVNNKLVKNLFFDPEGGPDGSVGVANTGKNNKLINNTIEGFDTAVADLGTDSKVHANKP